MIDLKPACRQMVGLLAAVTDEQLANSTPCAEYTLSDLIEHVDEVSQGFTAVARKDADDHIVTDPSPELVSNITGGRRKSVAEHVLALGEAWDVPQAWQGSTDAAGVELSNETWGKIALTEMVVHGWDIAQSCGHPFDLPEDTLRACLRHVTEFVPNAPVPELWARPAKSPPMLRCSTASWRSPATCSCWRPSGCFEMALSFTIIDNNDSR